MSRARDLANGTFSGAFSADSPTLVVDAANNRVGIGTATPGAAAIDAVTSTSGVLVGQFENSHATGSYGVVVKAGSDSGNYTADFRDKDNSTLMRIRGDGNVGIGETAPLGLLHIKSEDTGVSSVSAQGDLLVLEGTETGLSILSGSSAAGYINFGDSGDNDIGMIVYDHSANSFRIFNNAQERIRLTNGYDGNGAIHFGQYKGSGNYDDPGFNNAYGISIRSMQSTGPEIMVNTLGKHFWVHTGTGIIHEFAYKSSISTGGVVVGTISTNGSSTSYNTSSDYRLKEDWQPVSGSIDRVKALNPVNFAWKIDGSRVDGFLAHEVSDVVPEAITGEKDGMKTEEYEVTPAVLDEDGNVVTEAVMGTREVPEYQGIDQSKLVPLLTQALKDAITKIEALETRVSALEAV